MNRYNLVHGRFAGEPTAELELEDDGAWVLYRDVSDEIEQLQAENIQLKVCVEAATNFLKYRDNAKALGYLIRGLSKTTVDSGE